MPLTYELGLMACGLIRVVETNYEVYNVYSTLVRAHAQLPVKTTEFGVEFPASLTAVSYGGVSHLRAQRVTPIRHQKRLFWGAASPQRESHPSPIR